ncbi:MAG TPA: carboxypeptidase regulatory-like domain-containing protein [Candidatus Acidoferrum sp.]|nr:carboxypeptidase regulatory-like domain-containing protein [Candidatus Acidoferrum sp.]
MRPCFDFKPCFFRCLQVSIATGLVVSVFFVGFTQSTAAQGDPFAKVQVRVYDRTSEEFLVQVHVQLIIFPDEIVSEEFTGSDGRVLFSGISPVGAYTIRASRQGYEPGEADVDVRTGGGMVYNVDIPLLPQKQERKGASGGNIAAEDLRIPENARKEFERGRRLLNEKKDADGSITAFQRAIQLYPGYADAYFLMGMAQMQIKAAPGAEASLHKAIALDAHRTAPYYPLAMLLFGQRRLSEEHELLLQAQKQDAADWRWPFELARCEAQEGRWDAALQYGIEAGKNANAPTRVHLLLADIYANASRPREAVAELELFAKLDPQSTYMERVREVLPVLRQRAAASSPPEPH